MTIRLNKLMAERGLGARRKCDAMIEEGVVKLNGVTVTEPGIQIDPERDVVEVRGRRLPKASAKAYFMLHKPVGIISTLSDPEGRRTLRDFLPPGQRMFPVGRLDADTSGLLLLTNDGELAHHLMHPRYGVSKAYRVHVDHAPSPAMLKKLVEGIEFEPGIVSAPARARILDETPGDSVIEISIHEGRYRQVRRMCEAAGLHVHRLHRWAYGPLRLGDIARGMWRELSAEEVESLRAASARPRPRGEHIPPCPPRARGAGAVVRPERWVRKPDLRGSGGRPRGAGRPAPGGRPTGAGRPASGGRPPARTGFAAARGAGRGPAARGLGAPGGAKPLRRMRPGDTRPQTAPRASGARSGRGGRAEGRAQSPAPRGRGGREAPSFAPKGKGAPRGGRPQQFEQVRREPRFSSSKPTRAGGSEARRSREESFRDAIRGPRPSAKRSFSDAMRGGRSEGTRPGMRQTPRASREGGPRSGGGRPGGPKSFGPREGGARPGVPRQGAPRVGGQMPAGLRRGGPGQRGSRPGGPKSFAPRPGGPRSAAPPARARKGAPRASGPPRGPRPAGRSSGGQKPRGTGRFGPKSGPRRG